MLTTYNTMSLDRIHSMLSSYMPDYNHTSHSLNQFLQNLVKNDKLEFVGGEFSKKS